MAKVTKKQRENAITAACCKAVVGWQIPIMKLREVSAAAGRTFDAGGDHGAMVSAAREMCDKVGTRTDAWQPMPGDAPEAA